MILSIRVLSMYYIVCVILGVCVSADYVVCCIEYGVCVAYCSVFIVCSVYDIDYVCLVCCLCYV